MHVPMNEIVWCGPTPQLGGRSGHGSAELSRNIARPLIVSLGRDWSSILGKCVCGLRASACPHSMVYCISIY